jgi:hypothetical protein
VRQGYALPGAPNNESGLCPRYGLWPKSLGQSPHQGQSPFIQFRGAGKAQPCLTSGGRAVALHPPQSRGLTSAAQPWPYIRTAVALHPQSRGLTSAAQRSPCLFRKWCIGAALSLSPYRFAFFAIALKLRVPGQI